MLVKDWFLNILLSITNENGEILKKSGGFYIKVKIKTFQNS